MDPSYQRVEQSQVTFPHDDETESRCVVEGDCDMVIELGLGSGSVSIDNLGHDSYIDEPDDLFVERRDSVLEFRDFTSLGSDIRLITIESDSDDVVDDYDENEREMWGIDLNGDDVYDDDVYGDDDDVSVSIPLCWDSLQVEDRGVAAEEFDWEEVGDDGGGLVDDEREIEILTGFAEIDDGGEGLEDEREIEILTGFAEADISDGNSVSISISPMVSLEGLATGERTEGSGNLEWEVLLNSHTLEINFDGENREIYIAGDHDDYIHTTEYDTLFEQFAEAGITNLRLPPTSKSFIKDLPMVQLGVENDEGVVCAVCKDEMNIGTKAVGLPCDHKYHTECIVPWLETRNTCPVCRYELPTDDAEYEQRKIQRTTTTTTSSDIIW
ncbi:unnamed protein product [Eruca vesicaria subsp. sativa]|uniref:RING-type E3 ubiquitin transferase n=1 Tax=Eruca vesicaria subsp. sativa TaxID=29727 RepID=A0ABC8IQH8_ERUVS|nr:unnamed protein product [Eruca vesicaria subsp. sativa]